MSTKLARLRQSQASIQLASGTSAVVVGGTSGIGEAISIRLAQAGVSVTIIGRNKKNGQRIVEKMTSLSKPEQSKHAFLPCDVQLLSNVQECVRTVKSTHKKLDYLVLTQGIGTIQGRTETSEGLDQKMSLHYFSRIAFILGLLEPLKQSADARVLTVLGAGLHSPYAEYRSDMELRDNYSLKNVADATCFYNDLAVDSLSREYPRISFIHAAPGFVNTNWGTEMPWIIRKFIRMIQYFAKSAADCAEYMSAGLFSEEKKGGWHLISENGDTALPTSIHQEARDFVWKKTKAILQKHGFQ